MYYNSYYHNGPKYTPKNTIDLEFLIKTTDPKPLTLDDAIASGLNIYTKAIIMEYKSPIKYIKEAITNGDAELCGTHYKFKNDIFIFNVLHNNIIKIKAGGTLHI